MIGEPSAATSISMLSSSSMSTSPIAVPIEDEATALEANGGISGGGLSALSLSSSAKIDRFSGLPSLLRLATPLIVPFPPLCHTSAVTSEVACNGELSDTEDGVRRAVEAGDEAQGGTLRS